MADEIENGIRFDKEHWPKGGTTIPVITADFNTLWEKYEDQLTTLIAEQLIAAPPQISMDDPANMVIYLWEIGGDILCQHVSLAEMLDEYIDITADDLDEEQIEPALKALDEVQAAIDRVRVRIRNKRLEYKI